MIPVVLCAFIPVVLVCIRKYRVYKWGRCEEFPSLEGKVFLVTGATSGIGKETVRELVRRKARVIMACRDMNKAKKTITEIRDQEIRGELIPMELDLASLKSVREFVENVKRDFLSVDVLINNAGVYYEIYQDKKTEDGFEIHFGVNHLGHFLLTQLLLEKLQESSPSRVVNVTSLLFERSVDKFNVDAIPPGYASSKFANVLFSIELARRTSASGINVYAVCPGFCYTDLFRNSHRFKWYLWIVLAPVFFIYMRTASQGAQTVLHCAISNTVKEENGFIYRDCQRYVPKKKIDPEIGKRLWEISDKLVHSVSH